MSLPAFRLLRPRTIEEAAQLLSEHASGVRILAGGTDLVPSLKQQLFTPDCLLDISRIGELHKLNTEPDGSITIGAMTRVEAIASDLLIRREFSVLAQAATTIASPVLRNMGTLGGNICLDTRCLWYNQSLVWRQSCGFCLKKDGQVCHVAPGGKFCWAAFSGDMPPALLTLEAEVELVSATGARWLPLAALYTGQGDVRLQLRPDELLTRVRMPAHNRGMRGSYQKCRVRGSIDYPIAGVAMVLKRSNGRISTGRVALTAVNPSPRLVADAEKLLTGADPTDPAVIDSLVQAANSTAKPLSTSALTPDYRREIIKLNVRRAFHDCIALAD